MIKNPNSLKNTSTQTRKAFLIQIKSKDCKYYSIFKLD